MIDPPRPEAKEAVATCRKAGIKPVMITGDHVVTASAIAKELGILLDGDRAITGAELDAMDDLELAHEVENISCLLYTSWCGSTDRRRRQCGSYKSYSQRWHTQSEYPVLQRWLLY